MVTESQQKVYFWVVCLSDVKDNRLYIERIVEKCPKLNSVYCLFNGVIDIQMIHVVVLYIIFVSRLHITNQQKWLYVMCDWYVLAIVQVTVVLSLLSHCCNQWQVYGMRGMLLHPHVLGHICTYLSHLFIIRYIEHNVAYSDRGLPRTLISGFITGPCTVHPLTEMPDLLLINGKQITDRQIKSVKCVLCGHCCFFLIQNDKWLYGHYAKTGTAGLGLYIF